MICKLFILTLLPVLDLAACAGSARPSGWQMISNVNRLQLADAGYLGAWPSGRGGDSEVSELEAGGDAD